MAQGHPLFQVDTIGTQGTKPGGWSAGLLAPHCLCPCLGHLSPGPGHSHLLRLPVDGSLMPLPSILPWKSHFWSHQALLSSLVGQLPHCGLHDTAPALPILLTSCHSFLPTLLTPCCPHHKPELAMPSPCPCLWTHTVMPGRYLGPTKVPALSRVGLFGISSGILCLASQNQGADLLGHGALVSWAEA